MNILVIADVYPPEVSSAAHLMRELAEGLSGRGHKVFVATSYPKYYLASGTGVSFDEVSEESGIKVIRVRTLPHKKINFILRGISQLTLPFLFFSKIKKHIKEDIDSVIVYSPPITLGLAGGMVKRKYGAKFVLNLQDIFPQNAIDLGILKNKLQIWLLEFLERRAYEAADKITFHSEGGCRFLIGKKNVPEDKVVCLNNWVDINSFKSRKNDPSFIKKWGLEGRFIFLFAGIIGPAQGLEFLIEVAKRTRDLKEVIFLIVGDGSEKKKIEKLVDEYSLENVIIKPFVSGEEYPDLVGGADMGVVCLSKKNRTPFVPGKFLGYMAASLPVIAFLNKESDGFELVKKSKCGYAVESGDIDEAAKLIEYSYRNKEKLKEMGKNGYKYALDNFSLDVCLDRIEKIIKP